MLVWRQSDAWKWRGMLIALHPAVLFCQASASASTTATTSSAGKPALQASSSKSVRFDFDFTFRILIRFQFFSLRVHRALVCGRLYTVVVS